MKQSMKQSSKDFEDEDDLKGKGSLGYYVNQRVLTDVTVHINEAVVEPSYYTDIVNILYKASKEDSFTFMLNTPGGSYTGLVSLLDGIDATEAHTVANICGECHSAGSIIAMHCNDVIVGPYATMLCHNVSYGTGGKGSDVLAHVEHISKVSNNLIRTTYEGFLTETEIEEVLKGKQLYLEAPEIEERLDRRQKYFELKLESVMQAIGQVQEELE